MLTFNTKRKNPTSTHTHTEELKLTTKSSRRIYFKGQCLTMCYSNCESQCVTSRAVIITEQKTLKSSCLLMNSLDDGFASKLKPNMQTCVE